MLTDCLLYDYTKPKFEIAINRLFISTFVLLYENNGYPVSTFIYTYKSLTNFTSQIFHG